MTYNLFIFILLLLIVISILFVTIINYYKKIDTFDNKANYYNDGKMIFKYITDTSHTRNVLDKYYVNDDIKIAGSRVNIHPDEFNRNNCSVIGALPKVYGKSLCQLSPGIWNRYNTKKQDIYNNYAVRI